MAAGKEIPRRETREEVETYLARLKYAIETGARISIQMDRPADRNRPKEYTNEYTIHDLFPDEDPNLAIKRELKTLTVRNYLRTVKDLDYPNRSDLREFGKVYECDKEVYIKLRVEVLAPLDQPPLFVLSFHYAERPFSQEIFPYGNE